MSSNSKDISKIIAEGLDSFVYSTHSRRIWNTHPTEFACHDWLKEAYPDIYKEFVAVMEVAREI